MILCSLSFAHELQTTSKPHFDVWPPSPFPLQPNRFHNKIHPTLVPSPPSAVWPCRAWPQTQTRHLCVRLCDQFCFRPLPSWRPPTRRGFRVWRQSLSPRPGEPPPPVMGLFRKRESEWRHGSTGKGPSLATLVCCDTDGMGQLLGGADTARRSATTATGAHHTAVQLFLRHSGTLHNPTGTTACESGVSSAGKRQRIPLPLCGFKPWNAIVCVCVCFFLPRASLRPCTRLYAPLHHGPCQLAVAFCQPLYLVVRFSDYIISPDVVFER